MNCLLSSEIFVQNILRLMQILQRNSKKFKEVFYGRSDRCNMIIMLCLQLFDVILWWRIYTVKCVWKKRAKFGELQFSPNIEQCRRPLKIPHVHGMTMCCRRVSVVRGRVVDMFGAAVIGVRVSVITQPLYGFTLTRPNNAQYVAPSSLVMTMLWKQKNCHENANVFSTKAQM